MDNLVLAFCDNSVLFDQFHQNISRKKRHPSYRLQNGRILLKVNLLSRWNICCIRVTVCLQNESTDTDLIQIESE